MSKLDGLIRDISLPFSRAFKGRSHRWRTPEGTLFKVLSGAYEGAIIEYKNDGGFRSPYDDESTYNFPVASPLIEELTDEEVKEFFERKIKKERTFNKGLPMSVIFNERGNDIWFVDSVEHGYLRAQNPLTGERAATSRAHDLRIPNNHDRNRMSFAVQERLQALTKAQTVIKIAEGIHQGQYGIITRKNSDKIYVKDFFTGEDIHSGDVKSLRYTALTPALIEELEQFRPAKIPQFYARGDENGRKKHETGFILIPENDTKNLKKGVQYEIVLKSSHVGGAIKVQEVGSSSPVTIETVAEIKQACGADYKYNSLESEDFDVYRELAAEKLKQQIEHVTGKPAPSSF